jgi:branched-subunit amino acid transport protein
MNQTLNDWLYFGAVLLGLVAATVLPRSAFLLLPSRWQLPPAILEALRYAPIAAIAAIVVPDLMAWRPAQQGFTLTSVLSIKLMAAVLGAALHLRYANMLLTLAGGMSVFWLLRWAF